MMKSNNLYQGLLYAENIFIGYVIDARNTFKIAAKIQDIIENKCPKPGFNGKLLLTYIEDPGIVFMELLEFYKLCVP